MQAVLAWQQASAAGAATPRTTPSSPRAANNVNFGFLALPSVEGSGRSTSGKRQQHQQQHAAPLFGGDKGGGGGVLCQEQSSNEQSSNEQRSSGGADGVAECCEHMTPFLWHGENYLLKVRVKQH